MTSLQTNKIFTVSSINHSGRIFSISKIPVLKKKNYLIKPVHLDGNAPKVFIGAYFYTPFSTIRRANPRSWDEYIVKSAEKWYPHESIVEFLINRIGHVLGIKMNEVKLLRVNGQICFLSKFFLKKDENLIHGAEICGEHLEDGLFAAEIAQDLRSSRELFTFEFVSESITSVFKEDAPKILEDLVKMLVFDAIVGNNDRHFYNWAVIRSISKKNSPPRFSPLYDSARGLFWNFSDENLVKHSKKLLTSVPQKVKRYIELSSPRMCIDGDGETSFNHFKLIGYLSGCNPAYKKIIESLTNLEQEASVITMYTSEFSHFFIPERNELVLWLIKERFNQIRNVLKTMPT